mgnify:CR=1 FL=1
MVYFIVEDHMHEALLRAFQIHEKRINPVGSVSQVISALKNQERNSDKTIIGMVDEDKNNAYDFLGHIPVLDTPDDLIIKQKKDLKHYFLILKPAVEKWIWNACEGERINGFPRDYESLKDLKGKLPANTMAELVRRLKKLKKKGSVQFTCFGGFLSSLSKTH